MKSIQDNMQTKASVLDASFPDGKKPQVKTIESRLSGFLIGLRDRAYCDHNEMLYNVKMKIGV